MSKLKFNNKAFKFEGWTSTSDFLEKDFGKVFNKAIIKAAKSMIKYIMTEESFVNISANKKDFDLQVTFFTSDINPIEMSVDLDEVLGWYSKGLVPNHPDDIAESKRYVELLRKNADRVEKLIAQSKVA